MILSPHNPAWAVEFSALAAVLSAALSDRILRIEHIGSTAVPDLRAKPILDIDLVMPDYDIFPSVVEALGQLGYTHQGDLGIADREAFKRTDTQVPWTEPRRSWMEHHLYVCPASSKELHRHVKFRDVLRTRPDKRAEYEKLKATVEYRAHGDRKLYARIKEIECREFVEETLQLRP